MLHMLHMLHMLYMLYMLYMDYMLYMHDVRITPGKRPSRIPPTPNLTANANRCRIPAVC
jgi:hypothetical protein